MFSHLHQPAPGYIFWLRACFFFVFLMIAIGGYTRLSGSGLSIVEWRPITGTFLPVTEASWQEEFEKYQGSPEFQQVNFDISFDKFKFIYFVEYFHRLVGRLVGVIFFFPLVFFWLRGHLSPQKKIYFSLIGLLGFSQGFMGWYMVKSGLIHDPMVNPLRLTAHLILAVTILSLFYWEILRALYQEKISLLNPTLKILSKLALFFALLTLIYGGFVAGHKAGLIYNTFPLMNGHVLPSDGWDPNLGAHNFYENPVLVQFVHRFLAFTTATIGIAFAVKVIRSEEKAFFWAALFLLITLLTQVGLGITTLMYRVPLDLALTHQLLGAGVFLLILRFCYFSFSKRYS